MRPLFEELRMVGGSLHRAVTIACLAAAIILAGAVCARAAEAVFTESFDDADWTANPIWQASPADPSVSISGTRFVSPPYSLKVAANNSMGAIRANSGLISATQSFTCAFNLYVESIPEEGIPWCLQDAANNIVALIFLLPNGKVQLTEWQSGSWTRSDVPFALTYGQWHSFRITYDGITQSLYIDGHATPDATLTQTYSAAPTQIVIGNFMLPHTGAYYVDDLTIAAAPAPPPPPSAKVYVQFCSDTSTDGINEGVRYMSFPPDDYSYTSPTGQAAQVMAESYRNAHRDSLGNSIKLTWYMLGGSIYAFGATTGPLLPYELMMDNHGTEIARWGDEMAYHYHTWIWNGSAWSGTQDFTLCIPDFEQTVAHLMLDRGHYPSTFRSGWNWMNTVWENYLDDWFPYRFEGATPSGTWTPYHPSPTNWQAAGSLRGWESYYYYTPGFTQGMADGAFAAAYNGKDQVVCLYSHLKETDFPARIEDAHNMLAAAHAKYPTVDFEYVTGREAMLKWRNGTDTTPPVVTVSTSDSNDTRTATISTDEAPYQRQPFVALETTDGAYSRIDPTPAGTNRWTVSYNIANTARIAVAVTDWFGNPSVKALPVALRITNQRTTVTTTSAEITWDTSQPTDTRLDWRLLPTGGVTNVIDRALTTTHRVVLASLQPGRIYGFDISGQAAVGERVAQMGNGLVTRSLDPVVIDNSDPGFSVNGTWTTGNTAAGHYGADYRYIATSPTGSNYADWTWQAPAAGSYRVSVWWSQGTNRSTAAKYSVLTGGKDYPIVVNQQAGGGQWNAHGVYDLAARQSITVRLWNASASPTYVIADAARFELSGTTLESIALARFVPDGTEVTLPSATVTAVFSGEFYVQDATRSAGIRVIGGGVTEGATVQVSGTLSTANGERVIADSVTH